MTMEQAITELRDAAAVLKSMHEEATPTGTEPEVTLRARLRNVRNQAKALAERINNNL